MRCNLCDKGYKAGNGYVLYGVDREVRGNYCSKSCAEHENWGPAARGSVICKDGSRKPPKWKPKSFRVTQKPGGRFEADYWYSGKYYTAVGVVRAGTKRSLAAELKKEAKRALLEVEAAQRLLDQRRDTLNKFMAEIDLWRDQKK